MKYDRPLKKYPPVCGRIILLPSNVRLSKKVKYGETVEKYRRYLAINEKLLGVLDHPSTVNARNVIAILESRMQQDMNNATALTAGDVSVGPPLMLGCILRMKQYHKNNSENELAACNDDKLRQRR